MKKVLMIVGGVIIGVIILFLAIYLIVSLNSKELVCESNEGNITIMYNDEKITGYMANGIIYDLDGQKEVAEQIGIEQYIEEFSNWFSTNTTGSCMK